MKRSVILILIAFTLIILVSAVISKLMPQKPSDNKETGDPDEIIIEPVKEDKEISMYNHRTGKLEKMPLEDYLIGVIAGEMPASYDIEALKAQAVAARTRTVSQMQSLGGRGCNQMQGADICSSYAHCQEWISTDLMKNNWGGDYSDYYNKIKQAVYATRGLILKYDGKPIEVFFYSTSNGKTEDAGEVFSHSLPYYKVVDSEGEEDAPRFYGSVTYTNKEFADIFGKHYKTGLTSGNIAGQIRINGYTESGRVRSITVGGVTMKATEFRMMYGLNSTDFSLSFGDNSVTINTRGFGHGVGMSQVGADRMAKRGSSFEDILLHYYQGVSIGQY